MNESVEQLRYIHKLKKRKTLINFFRFFILASFIFLWEFTAKYGYIDDFIFCSPSMVYRIAKTMVLNGTLWFHMWVTIYETLLSFFLVMILGLSISIILWLSETLSKILEPYLVILNSLPKSALAPLLIVWLGNTPKTIIVTAVSVAVFGTIINLYTSFREVDSDKIKLIYTLGGTKKQVMTKVIIPYSLPVIVSSMKINIGLSLVGVIIGEFLASNAGLGYLIIYGSQVFKMDLVLMSIIILCILATILYLILASVEHIIAKRVRYNKKGKNDKGSFYKKLTGVPPGRPLHKKQSYTAIIIPPCAAYVVQSPDVSAIVMSLKFTNFISSSLIISALSKQLQ